MLPIRLRFAALRCFPPARHPQSEAARRRSSAWRANPQGVSALARCKPWLLRPLLAQMLPPPRRALDPAEQLGISVASLRTAAEMQQALTAVWAAVSRGEIAPAEAGRIARRVRTRLRALRRLARLQRRLARLAQKTDPVRPSLG
jgi:hypothetical protein